MSKSWKVGMERLAPGVYVDGNGAMHLDLVEMCVANGYAPTKQNQAMLERVVHETLDGIEGVAIVEVDK